LKSVQNTDSLSLNFEPDVTDTPAIRGRLPGLILIGVQKGGTSDLGEAIEKDLFCHSKSDESHFFDRADYADRPIPEAHIKQYLAQEWPGGPGCVDKESAKLPRFEKSPNYVFSPLVALRMCEAMGDVRIAVLLRNPVDRAYSSYWWDGLAPTKEPGHFKMPPSGIAMRDNGAHSAKNFDHIAKAEIAIVKHCNHLLDHSGVAEKERRSAPAYLSCSRKVSEAFDLPNFDDCKPEERDTNEYQCSFLGDKRAQTVRGGLYVQQLRRYYAYHRSENILIVKTEDLFDHFYPVAREIARFANRPDLTVARAAAIERAEIPIHGDARSSSSDEDMWDDTRSMLQKFYQGFNDELDELVGRKMNWW
jgi:hypothetical protein